MAGFDGDRIKLSKAEGRGGWEEATKDTEERRTRRGKGRAGPMARTKNAHCQSDSSASVRLMDSWQARGSDGLGHWTMVRRWTGRRSSIESLGSPDQRRRAGARPTRGRPARAPARRHAGRSLASCCRCTVGRRRRLLVGTERARRPWPRTANSERAPSFHFVTFVPFAPSSLYGQITRPRTRRTVKKHEETRGQRQG